MELSCQEKVNFFPERCGSFWQEKLSFLQREVQPFVRRSGFFLSGDVKLFLRGEVELCCQEKWSFYPERSGAFFPRKVELVSRGLQLLFHKQFMCGHIIRFISVS